MLSMKPTPIHTAQNQSRHSYFAHLLEQEMVRIRVAAEELQKLDPPPRSRTAPILADKAKTPVTLGKRARSESVEPTRSSKRLRGIATQLIVVEEDDDVVVLPGGWATGGKNSNSPKKDFTRTISTQSSSTVFDQETRTPTSLSPDKETPATAAAPISQDAPTNSQFSTSTVDTDPDTSLQMSSPMSPKPLYRNIPPLPVLIDGYPSLRVVFRDLCLYRITAPSPIHEWQSYRFFSHITDPAVRTEQEQTQTRDGVVFIPDTLFESSPETDSDIILDLVHEFLEQYSLPKQAITRFDIFTDPVANILEPRRISWWKLLADHFRIPHNLDKVFNTTHRNWHFAYHSLPTFAGLRELSELAENWGFKRGREMVHQEIARRIAFIKGKGDRKAQTQFRLLKKGYEELREMSREYDHRSEERFDGQTAMENCIMCRVQPAF
jgi:hypothetical protein